MTNPPLNEKFLGPWYVAPLSFAIWGLFALVGLFMKGAR